ncbi:MAG TPA: hypothetical protein VER14_05215, partial [Phototrophicaceae bacterium]|nr:hypothetical protein [Phototrophicaceae bacterium]
MEGPVIVSNSYYNNNNKNQNVTSSKDSNPFPSQSPSPQDNYSNEFTEVYHGSGNANNLLLGFIDRAKTKIDSVISYTAPSVIIETDAIREKRKNAVSQR